jgi:hypothetical protein
MTYGLCCLAPDGMAHTHWANSERKSKLKNPVAIDSTVDTNSTTRQRMIRVDVRGLWPRKRDDQESIGETARSKELAVVPVVVLDVRAQLAKHSCPLSLKK